MRNVEELILFAFRHEIWNGIGNGITVGYQAYKIEDIIAISYGHHKVFNAFCSQLSLLDTFKQHHFLAEFLNLMSARTFVEHLNEEFRTKEVLNIKRM